MISDTHVTALDDIPKAIANTLAGVDLIVHAGDFTEMAVLDGLRRLGEVRAVCGNMDSYALRQALPGRDVFDVGGKKIGLVHGAGERQGIAERIRNLFEDVDVIIYGHSHEPMVRTIRGSLLFNPGSARRSFGVLTIGEDVKAEIVEV